MKKNRHLITAWMNREAPTNTLVLLKQYANDFIRGISQQVSQVSFNQWKTVFFGVLFAYTALLVFESLGYSADARLFPLIIGVSLLGMLLVNIVLIHYPTQFSSESGGLFDSISEEIKPDQTNEETEEPTAVVRIYREITMVLWIFGVFVLIWLIGFLNAFAVFIFSFIYVYEEDLIRAGGVSLLSLLFMYALFVELLSLPIWEGILLSGFVIAKPKLYTTND